MDNYCKICFKKFNSDDRKPTCLFPCGHTFCFKCTKEISKCGLCRSDFQTCTNWQLIPDIESGKCIHILTDLMIKYFHIDFSQFNAANMATTSNDSYINDSLTLFCDGQYREALDTISKIKVCCNDYYVLFAIKGVCNYYLSDFKKAYKQLKKLDNSNIGSFMNISSYYKALICIQLGHFSEAIEFLDHLKNARYNSDVKTLIKTICSIND
jgi:tetratricopeptide (TPR) repeat protein